MIHMKDNLFPSFDNQEICWVQTFATRIQYLPPGDILEFGAGSGRSAMMIAQVNPERKIFTFDHFQGLEQTKKSIPEGSGWEEGAFRLGHPDLSHWPQNAEEFKQYIKEKKNIVLNIEDIHQLKDPSDYDIGLIVAVNIDVDIYEPCVSALRFIDRCEWSKILLRFDDWHGGEPAYDEHERLACWEWLHRTQYRFSILENGSASCLIVSR